MTASTQTCPYCREALATAEVQVCPHCGTPHHADCWQENGGCTVFGCQSAPADDPKLSLTPGDLSAPIQRAPPGTTFYVAHAGERLGPFSVLELTQILERGEITSRDLVWGQGFPEWIPCWQAFGVADPESAARALPGKPKFRFGRSIFAVSWLGLVMLVLMALNFGRARAGRTLLVGQLAWVGLSYPRLRDLGMSRPAALLILVPGANLWLTVRCLFAPHGYARTHKSDQAMRVWSWSVLISLALLLLLSLVVLALQ